MRALAIVVVALGIAGLVAVADPAPVVHAASRVSKTQPANLTRTTLLIGGRTVVGAFEIDGDGENGALHTVQPGVAVWDADSGAMRNDRQINVPPNGEFTTSVASATHDAPSLVQTATGGILAVYGAVSTYGPYHPPASWHCSSGVACEPFKYADASKANASLVDALAESPEHLLPSVGLSEVSYATLGRTTIIAGQQQPGSRYGEAGTQAYVTLHATAGGGTFDTTAGPWNFTSSHAAPGDGLEAPSLAPMDDAYVDFGITGASGGSGTVELTIGGVGCHIDVSGASSPADAASAIARAFGTSCGALRNQYGAMQVAFDPVMIVGGAPLAPAVVGITTRLTSPPPLTAVTLHCTGSIACASPHGPDTVAMVRGSGLHRHYLYGGVLERGSDIFYLMDVEQVTGSWYGRGASSLGLALVCLRAREPVGETWTWTDCAGEHPFTLRPGMVPVMRFGSDSPYLVRAPQGGYRGGMSPYVFDWTQGGQEDERGFPVIASVSAAFMRNGMLMLGHGCETADKVITACYAVYDTRTGETRAAGTIASPPGGSLASFALRTRSDGSVEAAVLAGLGERWGCAGGGTCMLTYRYDESSERWEHLGTVEFGGANNSGFPGSITVSGDRFVVQLHRQTAAGYDVETQVRS